MHRAQTLAHGFTTAPMVEFVRAGLATASAERVVPGRDTAEVARVRQDGKSSWRADKGYRRLTERCARHALAEQ
jgi:hypothetical protein